MSDVRPAVKVLVPDGTEVNGSRVDVIHVLSPDASVNEQRKAESIVNDAIAVVKDTSPSNPV